ncbi:MAG: hypothetical protein NDJ90_14735 [Oligoflexia bacterium]|nr:hypothetical protein [Oligoflexia bacterium]
MNLPPATDPRWGEIITGKSKYPFDFLAAKIFVARASMDVVRDSSPTNVQQLCGELRELFSTNSRLASVKRDLQRIFG